MTLLVCKECKKEHSPDKKIWKCECGNLLDIDFNASFPIEKIKEREPSMWRYREAIPIQQDENIISFNEGFTPLVDVNIKGKNVLIKQDQLFSTGSYKDRGASVLISKAYEAGINKVVEDSSGNAGCAIASYCAKADIDCDIYVPADNPPSKLIQIESYGANVHKIPGSREDTANAVLKSAEENYYASHSWNPFFFHGTKTFAFEVCEQLGWNSPDTIILPVGNGTILLGAYIGFNELKQAGIISKIPKIVAVQTQGCNPLFKSFKQELNEIPSVNKKDTIAEGIAIASPVRGKDIFHAVRESGGDFVEVSDDEIKSSLIDMCNKGFYIEPTSASTIAGINKYLENNSNNGKVVSVFTGHGLKNTDKILKIFNKG